MSKRKIEKGISVVAGIIMAMTSLTGCTQSSVSSKVEVELVSYKPEAVEAFEEIAELFNATHDDIQLTIDSPNEAMTILKTRFIREDYPDIVGIGGDVNYSNFLDADLFMDISDFEGLEMVKQSYLDMDKELEFVPTEGVYALPYAANAAGILYNKDMFEEHGWEIPNTWNEFLTLCEEIKACEIQPLYLGYKDTWTCLAPWNALAVGLTDSDTCNQVNMGNTTFAVSYREVAEKIKVLLDYAEPNPYAYGYNDACTAFARGNLGKAAALADSEEFMDMHAKTIDILKNIYNEPLYLSREKMMEVKGEISEVLDTMRLWYRDVVVFKATQDSNLLIFKDEQQAIKYMADHSSFNGLNEIQNAIEKAEVRLKANVGYELTIELLLLTLREN